MASNSSRIQGQVDPQELSLTSGDALTVMIFLGQDLRLYKDRRWCVAEQKLPKVNKRVSSMLVETGTGQNIGSRPYLRRLEAEHAAQNALAG